MSQPDTAAALSEQHRQAQLRIRSSALRDFLLLWPLWTGDSDSFGRLVQATLPLISVYRRASASVAGSYYATLRTAEDIKGSATIRLASAIAPEKVTASMHVTGQALTHDALSAGRSATEARRVALTRVSGAVTRHVLDGGRETVLDSVAADHEALGWARLTDGKPCAFCAMLAARGAVYKTETTADFQAHDHCACQAIPLYKGSKLPRLNREFRDLYDRAQREAEASGELDRGTANDRLNAFRRLYDAQHAT